MFEIHPVSDDVIRVALTFPDGPLGRVLRQTNVYVCLGEAPALINGGHHTQFTALSKALAELDVPIESIDRVIYTSWAPQHTGAANYLPNVTHWAASPDLIRPADYRREFQTRRDELAAILNYLEADVGLADDYFGPLTTFPTAPLVNQGHVVAGNLDLTVVGVPGPDSGTILLHSPERQMLFTSEIAYSGVPFWIDETQGYLVGIERAIALAPNQVLPNTGIPSLRGTWMLQRSLRWSNNFLTNAAGLLFGAPTLKDHIERDLGRDYIEPLELALRMATVRPFLDELVRTNMIQVAGSGLDTRYGVNIADPSAHLRPWT